MAVLLESPNVVTSRRPRRPRWVLVEPGVARQIRVLSGTTIATVAHQIGVSPATVFGWEHGRRAPGSRAVAERHQTVIATLALNVLSYRLSH